MVASVQGMNSCPLYFFTIVNRDGLPTILGMIPTGRPHEGREVGVGLWQTDAIFTGMTYAL